MFNGLAIVVPWDTEFSYTRFWFNYCNLVKPRPSRLIQGIGTRPHLRHERGCYEALKSGASHIVILGADQIYPVGILPRLLNHQLPCVSCLIPMRGYVEGQGLKPFQAGAWKKVVDSDGKETFLPVIRTGREENNLISIDVTGTGCLMFESKILNSIPRPWFNDVLVPGSAEIQAIQDSNFVMKIRKAGFPVYCDVHPQIKHIGVFEIDDTYPQRFPDWMGADSPPDWLTPKEVPNGESASPKQTE